MAAAVLAVAGSLLAGMPGAAAATDKTALDTLLSELNLAESTEQGTAAELRTAVTRRLGEVQAAVHKCNVELPRAFRGQTADQVLRSIRQGAGQPVAVSEAAYAALKRAAGGNLGVAQSELDLCVRARDMDVGGRPTDYVLTMWQIDRTLQQCLSLARSGVPNQAAFKVITGLAQEPGSDTYTKPDTVAALNRAICAKNRSRWLRSAADRPLSG